MAVQINLTMYKLNNAILNPVQIRPVPAAGIIARAATLASPGLNYVNSVVHYQDLGQPMEAYVSETVASIVTSANS